MKKAILALLIGLFSVNGVWADDNDTNEEDIVEKQFKKDHSDLEFRKSLCVGHWNRIGNRGNQPELTFGKKANKDCFNQLSADISPKGGSDRLEIIERGRDGFVNLTPGNQVVEFYPETREYGKFFNTTYWTNIAYVINFPEDDGISEGNKKFDFTPQFDFDFRTLKEANIKNLPDQFKDGHLIFESSDKDIGIMFDIRVGRGGGEWVPVTQRKQSVEGGKWFNTKSTTGKQRWYYASLRAHYILLDPTKIGSELIIKGSPQVVAYVSFKAKGIYEDILTRNINNAKEMALAIRTKSVTFHQKVTTCRMDEFTRGQTTVKLVKGLAPKINPEAYAGSFQLNLFCNNYNKTPPKIFMTFSAATQGGTNANHGEDLLEIEKGDNKATGVALRIKNNQTGEVVRFGPQSRAPGNIGQFKLPQNPANGESIGNKFDVYYVKTGNEITPGKVKAKATFTFSYQ